MERNELIAIIADLKEKLASAEAELATLPNDITDEIKVEIGTDETGIRAYFTHNGNVIVRAGMGKGAELTSYGASHGYSVVEGRMGLRGAFFKVFKTQ